MTTEPTTRRVVAKPFGADKAHALMVKTEALNTMTRQEAFDRGYLTVKDLDDEELRAGRCREANGIIPTSKNPHAVMIPQDKYDEMVREHELRFQERLRQNLDDMLDVMISVAKDDTAEPRDKFEAAKYLFERTAGRTAETVKHTVELKPWEGVLTDITGIGAISRSEHRRMKSEGLNAGIIDVEFDDEDPVQSDGVPQSSQAATQQALVQVHQARPEQPGPEPSGVQQEAGDQEQPSDGHAGVPVRPAIQPDEPGDGYQAGSPPEDEWRDPSESWARVEVDTPDPVTQYGSRRTEKKTYADQVREAERLQQRRKEARDARKGAVKARKIARATGADAITDDITGMELGDDGQLKFD